MPKNARGPQRPRTARSPSPKRTAVARDRSLTRRIAASPRELVARICEHPELARAIPHLPPDLLHHVIQHCGLEDCGDLLALVTTKQMSALFDLDLWRMDRPGDERFDPARFCAWLDVLAGSGVDIAARRLAQMDPALAIAGLAPQIAVFDPAVLPAPADADGFDVEITHPTEGGLHRDVGGYTVVARRPGSWDTIVAVLVALADENVESFHRVMQGCRHLSNSTPEIDGLDDLLPDSAQALFDLNVAREGRREQRGYVPPPHARAFLESSRQLRLQQETPPPASAIFTTYLRNVAWSAEPQDLQESGLPRVPDNPVTPESVSAVAAVVSALLDGGVVPKGRVALLGAPVEEASHGAHLRPHMQFVRERDEAASMLRTQELAFLANVLLAGCSVQERPLTTREAFDAAAATCNLGLENWPHQWLARSRPVSAEGRGTTTLPEDFLLGHDLVTVFQAGWTVLHANVSMVACERLRDALAGIECSDREIEFGLHVLRRELTRHGKAGAPWRARAALDVLASLDMPAWAALLGLIDELPVMLANVGRPGTARRLTISTSAFEFISSNRQIADVLDFLDSLPRLLSR
jgi:hypothetical protein